MAQVEAFALCLCGYTRRPRRCRIIHSQTDRRPLLVLRSIQRGVYRTLQVRFIQVRTLQVRIPQVRTLQVRIHQVAF